MCFVISIYIYNHIKYNACTILNHKIYIADSKKVEQVNFKKQDDQNTSRRLKPLINICTKQISVCESFMRKNGSLNNTRLLRILAYTTQHMLSL